MEVITTNHDKCVSCHKCINVCPTEFANVVTSYNGKSVMAVNQDLCIGCGECVAVCDHEARDYVDDTEQFFADLEKGIKISLTVAPSAKFNFPKLEKLFGFLKSKGVQLIYDVSLGADITTWAYIKAIEQYDLDTVIAQPCPVVVTYIERYKPEVIDRLAKIQSPLMCTAIYLKEYEQVNDNLAFLSPCIAKLTEIRDPNTKNLIQYNVTFKKMLAYIERNQIDLIDYVEKRFDNIGAGLGVVFSRPGGLRENLEYHVPGAWVRQIEGVGHLYRYLDEYVSRIQENREVPLLIDCLNCTHGCNIGTGTTKEVQIDDIDALLKRVREKHLNHRDEKEHSAKKKYELFELFNKKLRLDSFIRQYTDQSRLITHKEPTQDQLSEVFTNMYKLDDDSKKVNCYSCGYRSCATFAKAVFNGYNQIESCFQYNLKVAHLEHEENEAMYDELQALNDSLEQKVKDRTQELEKANLKLGQLLHIDALTNMPNRRSFDQRLAQEWKRSIREQEPLSVIMLDIDCFKEYNDNYGHVQGDECLQIIAKELVSSVGRGTDYVARYGGEEFVMLLPNTSAVGAFIKAEMIRKNIENLKIFHEFSVVKNYVTVSLGINTIVASVHDSIGNYINRADKAMYYGKATGRNRTTHANEMWDTNRS